MSRTCTITGSRNKHRSDPYAADGHGPPAALTVWAPDPGIKQGSGGDQPSDPIFASKPVSRVLSLKTAIYLDAPLPTRSSHLPGTAGPAVCPSTVLLRIEFTAMGSFQPSGELLPRLSTLTSSPVRGKAVSLCCTFPRVASGGRYPLSLPCGARTFLMNGLSALSTWLSSLLAVFYYIGREAHCQFD